MRRKPDVLIPLEVAICEAALELRQRGVGEFHGYLIAKFIREEAGARRLASQGTLYRALDRLEKRGLLTRRWEDPAAADVEGRPPRRLYTLTPAGREACLTHRAELDIRPQLRAVWKLS